MKKLLLILTVIFLAGCVNSTPHKLTPGYTSDTTYLKHQFSCTDCLINLDADYNAKTFVMTCDCFPGRGGV